MLPEDFSQVAIRTLEEHQEEKVLREADRVIAIDINLFQNVRSVLLQVLFGALEVISVTEGCHGMQEVPIAHPQLALFRPLTRKHFKRLLRR